jgi:hypothetical protein
LWIDFPAAGVIIKIPVTNTRSIKQQEDALNDNAC